MRLQPQRLVFLLQRYDILVECVDLSCEIFLLFLEFVFIDCINCCLPLLFHLGKSLFVTGDLGLELTVLHHDLVLLRHFTNILN